MRIPENAADKVYRDSSTMNHQCGEINACENRTENANCIWSECNITGMVISSCDLLLVWTSDQHWRD
jgi:hypothetical protein